MAESAMSDILDAFNSWVTLDYSGDHGEAAMAARERALAWIALLESEQSRLAVENQSLKEDGRQVKQERDAALSKLAEKTADLKRLMLARKDDQNELDRFRDAMERIHAIADDPKRALGRWTVFRTLGEIRDMASKALANQAPAPRIGCTHCEGDSVCSKCGQVKIKDDDGATD